MILAVTLIISTFVIIAVAIFDIEKKNIERWDKIRRALDHLKDKHENYSVTMDDLFGSMKREGAERNADLLSLAKRLENVEKEFEIMAVRQRTLEKKIIGQEKTINLNIMDQKRAKNFTQRVLNG